MKRVLLAATVLGALLAACGGGRTDETARSAGIVPPDVIAFVSLSLDPSIEQKRHLMSVAQAFPQADLKGEFDDARDELLTDLADEAGLDYEADIEPAIGDEIALVVFAPESGDEEPPAAVVVEIDDREAAERLAARGDEMVAYRLLEDHLLATAAGPGADAVFARFSDGEGASLATTESFENLTGQLHGDRLLLGWVDVPRIAELTEEQAAGTFAFPELDFEETLGTSGPAAFDLHAEDKSIVFEAVATATGEENGGRPELTEGLPADLLGALTVFDIDDSLGHLVDPLREIAGSSGGGDVEQELGLDIERDLLSWLGDEVVVAVGEMSDGLPEAAILVRPSDRAAAEAAVPRLAAAAESFTGPLTRIEIAGGTVHVIPAQAGEEMPIRPAFGLLEDRFVLATTPEYLERVAGEAGDSFGESDGYQSVIDTSTSGATNAQLVLDLDAIREALEQIFGLAEDEGYLADTQPNLEPLDHFGLRAARVGNLNRFRAELTVS